MNDIRKEHSAFVELRTIAFHHADNEEIIVYSKRSGDGTDVMLCVVNLDPLSSHEATLSLDLDELGVALGATFEVHDELSRASYTCAEHPYVPLDPAQPARPV